MAGIKRELFYDYVLRGIALPHLAPTSVKEAVSRSRCLEYDATARRLRILPMRLVQGGYGYVDRESVEALRRLNAPCLEGWMPLHLYARSVAAQSQRPFSRDDLRRLRRTIACLCAKGEIRASRGLSSRTWYVAPDEVRRPSLAFMRFSHGQLVLFFAPAFQVIDAELRKAVKLSFSSGQIVLKACSYSLDREYVGLLYSSRQAVLARLQADARPITSTDLAIRRLGQALRNITRELAHQRRVYLPLCQAPADDAWTALATFYRRKARYRRLPAQGNGQPP